MRLTEFGSESKNPGVSSSWRTVAKSTSKVPSQVNIKIPITITIFIKKRRVSLHSKSMETKSKARVAPRVKVLNISKMRVKIVMIHKTAHQRLGAYCT